MTTRTKEMDFSRVGGTAMQAASTKSGDGLPPEESERYLWLWEFLHEKHMTDMAQIRMLGAINDEVTLQLLRSGANMILETIGLPNPNAFQEADLNRLTRLLTTAYELANHPDTLTGWAARKND